MWKDFQELEDSLSMPELNAILVESRKKIYDDRKFHAAIQGVDIGAGESEEAWESVKERAERRVKEALGEEPDNIDPNIREFMDEGFDYVDLTGGDG